MKTYILQLEAYDDLISVRDKMGWAKNGRLVIVWPENEGILGRKLDLLLIRRRSQELGSQLAFVSRDREVRYQALNLGIPVYQDLRKAQEPRWRVPSRFRQKSALTPEEYRQLKEEFDKGRSGEEPDRNVRPLKPAVRLLAFLAGILAFLSIAATLAPGARITLTPRTIVQDMLIDIQTSPTAREINLTGIVPSELVTVEVEARDTMPVSGSVRLPTEKAHGEVEFTNLTDKTIVIPAGAVASTVGDKIVHFEVVKAVELTAGPGSTIRTAVICLTPGENGNLPVGVLTAIEGGLGTDLAVTNPEPTTGGTDRSEPASTTQDLEKLAERLEKTLLNTARQEIQANLEAGDVLLVASLEPLRKLDEKSEPDVGMPADEVTLILRMEYQARVIRYKSIVRLAEMVFSANLPDNYEVLPESLQIELVKAPEQAPDGVLMGQLHASRRAIAKIREAQVIRLALSVSPTRAISQLQTGLPLDGTPEIQMRPAWWPRMPILPFRIEIINQNPVGASTAEVGGS